MSDPLDILVLSHEPLFPPTGGGSSECGYIVDELVRRGHRVRFIGPLHPNSQMADLENRFGIEVIPFRLWPMGRYTSLRTIKYLAYPLALCWLVRRELRHRTCDVLLSQHAISSVAAGIIGKKMNIPVTMNFLDFLTGFMESWPRYKMPGWILRRLQKFELSQPVRYQANAVLTVSDALKRRFIEAGTPEERLQTIYFGFDAAHFPWSRRENSSWGPRIPGRWMLVMHGSMDAHHLGGMLEDALVQLNQWSQSQVDTAITMRFIGKRTPILDAMCRRLQNRAPEIMVECLGFIEYSKLSCLLSEADIGIVPYESNPGSQCAFVAKAVEYVACGLPVVATSLEGIQSYFSGMRTVRFAGFSGASLAHEVLQFMEGGVEIGDLLSASQQVHRELNWQQISSSAAGFIEDRWQHSRSGTG